MTALLVVAVALSASPTKLSERDTHTLSMLHHHDAVMNELGKLAKTQAGTVPVKAFGALMAKDSDFIDRQLLKLAGGSLPPFLPADDAERAAATQMQDTVERLKTLKGEEFDRVFTDALMRWSQSDISVLEAQRSMTQEPKVYALFGKIIPVLREHRAVAEKLIRSPRNG